MCDEHQEGLVRGLEINVAERGGSSRWKMGLLNVGWKFVKLPESQKVGRGMNSLGSE